MENNNFFYFIQVGKYNICDLEFCSKSEKTFDISLFDLANNEKLLNLLHLYYMQGNYGVKYTYESRAKWFCGYLSAFKTDKDRRKLQYEKSLTNPIVRILIEDNSLLEEIKN